MLLATAACGDGTGPNGAWNPLLRRPSPEYLALLELFPEESQGLGPDASFGTVAHQPMTYGLLLMAESRRQIAAPNEESPRRLRAAAEWLVANADLDGDGDPGWGLPDAWDAFGDGSVNPADLPYTITSAIVVDGLLDLLAVPGVLPDEDRERSRDVITVVLRRWAGEAFTATADGGGFFWYSVSPADSFFSVNPSAMLAGATQRYLAAFGDGLGTGDRLLLQDAADRAARSVALAVMPRGGRPYWHYIAVPNRFGQEEPNDAVHHAYIVWGMEDYRRHGGSVALPWSPEDARVSLDPYVADGTIHEYPQDVAYDLALYRERPARLWGAGMLAAVRARLGDGAGAGEVYRVVEALYGPGPAFRRYPAWYSADAVFYPRMAAHVLLGLAERDFRGAVR